MAVLGGCPALEAKRPCEDTPILLILRLLEHWLADSHSSQWPRCHDHILNLILPSVSHLVSFVSTPLPCRQEGDIAESPGWRKTPVSRQLSRCLCSQTQRSGQSKEKKENRRKCVSGDLGTNLKTSFQFSFQSAISLCEAVKTKSSLEPLVFSIPTIEIKRK